VRTQSPDGFRVGHVHAILRIYCNVGLVVERVAEPGRSLPSHGRICHRQRTLLRAVPGIGDVNVAIGAERDADRFVKRPSPSASTEQEFAVRVKGDGPLVPVSVT